MKTGSIKKVSGPLVIGKGMEDAQLYDVVRVGNNKLIGEIIEARGSEVSIQVYEETSGIGADEPIYYTNEQLSLDLGPGLLKSIFDGIQRPLLRIRDQHGYNIPVGVDVSKLDYDKLWSFNPLVKIGDYVEEGDFLGEVDETDSIKHFIMVPIGKKGKVIKIEKGSKKLNDVVCIIVDDFNNNIEITMLQKWPIRRPRPYKKKLKPSEPMITGQRVIDSFFPITQGGVAAIPGPFGSGKTVVQQQLAKWSNVDIIIYIGCGERGNEITDVLHEFPELVDPKTGKALINKVVIIANTSNMPVAAREASIYTGITIAEYYRDMGYKIAIMADSTSRWAEALREMSSRLEEMPGEEGYPSYLNSRLANFYERAGVVQTLNNNVGSITAIGAVSPPGGDTSEPVSQATLRIVKVFWGLSYDLAYKRHFPAIDWMKSYSLYSDDIKDYYNENINKMFKENINEAMNLLFDEAELLEAVKLIGIDSLNSKDRVKLHVAKMIREDYLHQNAYHKIDSYTSIKKQFLMLDCILYWYNKALDVINNGIRFDKIEFLKVNDNIAKMKYIEELIFHEEYNKITELIDSEFKLLIKE